MVNFSIQQMSEQASAARNELVSLPLYASQHCDASVLTRALELTRVFLPAELVGSVDDILFLYAKNGARQEAGAA